MSEAIQTDLVLLCSRFLEFAEFLQISAFLRDRLSQHFRSFTRVAAQLLHMKCFRYLNHKPLESLQRSPYFGVERGKEKLVRSLLSLGLPWHGNHVP